MAEVSDGLLAAVDQHMPNVDIIGVNSYSGCVSLGTRVQKSKKPDIVTEFGTIG